MHPKVCKFNSGLPKQGYFFPFRLETKRRQSAGVFFFCSQICPLSENPQVLAHIVQIKHPPCIIQLFRFLDKGCNFLKTFSSEICSFLRRNLGNICDCLEKPLTDLGRHTSPLTASLCGAHIPPLGILYASFPPSLDPHSEWRRPRPLVRPPPSPAVRLDSMSA